MKRAKINLEQGQASKILLALAIIIVFAIIIAYIVIKAAETPPKPSGPIEEVPLAVYETTLGNLRFTFQEARDFGSVLRGVNSRNPQYQKDLITTERYIMVTIGAENVGKQNTGSNSWDIGNIVDSDGRNYVPMDHSVNNWLPNPNLCGTLLKPAFAPVPCVKIYEVAKVSSGLKIQIVSKKNSGSGKDEQAQLDLIVIQ